MITRDQLNNYRQLLKEIPKTEKDIERLVKRQQKIPTVKDKVQASMEEFPYTLTHVTVDALDPFTNSTIERLLVKKRRLLNDIQAERLRIEDFINGIEDSRTRRIFDLVFVQGKSQQAAAMEVGLEQSWVSRIIAQTLKENVE